MAGTIINIIDTYNDLMENHSDPRTKDWFMLSSSMPMLHLIAGYILLSKLLLGLTKSAKPLDLNIVAVIYNAVQCVLSIWLFCAATPHIAIFSLRYNSASLETDPETDMILNVCWYFFVFRFLDFIDTFILILRQKTDQVTFTHLLYNSMVPIILWCGLKFVPESLYTMGTYINIFVYILLYIKNDLEGLNPAVKNYLPWATNPTIPVVHLLFIIVQSINNLQSNNYAAVYGIATTVQNIILYGALYKDILPEMSIIYDTEKMKEIVRSCSKLGEMCIPNQSHLLDDDSEIPDKIKKES